MTVPIGVLNLRRQMLWIAFGGNSSYFINGYLSNFLSWGFILWL